MALRWNRLLGKLVLGLLSAGLVRADPHAVGTPVKTMSKQLNDGTDMPMMGLGTWKAKDNEVEGAVYHAICKAGYRHIDAAQIYMNQEQVGAGIRRAIAECGMKRKDIWVTSKIWPVDFDPKDLPAAADRILRELGLDYVDQLLLHWPVAYAKPPPGCPSECPEKWAGTDDPLRPRGGDGQLVHGGTSLVDTWKALEKEKRDGKVRSIGVSNFQKSEIKTLKWGPEAITPSVNQVEAHVFWHQHALIKEMQEMGIAVVAYSPLGNPALYAGKLNGLEHQVVLDVAATTGLKPAQVMLNFLLAQGVIVVPKSVTPERIVSNIDFKLNLSGVHILKLATQAPQQRLANPNNRPGGKPMFVDANRKAEL